MRIVQTYINSNITFAIMFFVKLLLHSNCIPNDIRKFVSFIIGRMCLDNQCDIVHHYSHW